MSFKFIFQVLRPTIIIFSLIIITLWLWPFNNTPEGFVICSEGYYKCEKCKSLDGGIFGKGPCKNFMTKKATFCIHKWEKISKSDFRIYATQWFNYDWTKEDGLWWNDWQYVSKSPK